ncbi:serine/threonine-protein kinase [Streptomyces sp. NPDC127069]|uniref:serine/threonine-protein kinase n=1 Tax=Streptomyces sp. NPDC127069 TaxID=3347128 RepID=UPI00364A6C97
MTQIGDYTVVRPLGSGGMGSVYLAQSRSGRLVAIKVIRPEYAADPQFRARFRQEVEAARKVGGFHTAAVVDADPDAPQPWMASAYVEGPTLQAEVARQGPFSEVQLWWLTAALAEALVAIHSHGLVHRDLKPANIVLASDGPRVLDFGIARAMEESGLTADGFVVGTAGYHSPEQARGHLVTGASDVFALGAVLVSASGGSAFGDGSAAGLLYRVVHEDPDVSTVPPSLRPLVLACLRKEPSTRPSPTDLLDLCARARAEAAPTHDTTALADEPAPPSRPPQPLTQTAETPAPPDARYRFRRSTWLLQLLCTGSGVAGSFGVGLLTGGPGANPVIPGVALIGVLVLAVRFLGLLIAANQGLILSSHGVGVGSPHNHVLTPWQEVKVLELTRYTRRTKLTVHTTQQLDRSHYPFWVRLGRGGVIRIPTRRLSPVGTAPALREAVHTFAGWRQIRVSED